MLAEGSVGCHLTNTEQREVKIKRPSVNQTHRWGDCFLLLLFGLTAASYPVFSVLGVFMWVFKCIFLLFLLLTLCGITSLFFWIFRFFFPHFSKVENVGFRFSSGCFFCHSSGKLRDFLTLKWFIFTFISTGFCASPPPPGLCAHCTAL